MQQMFVPPPGPVNNVALWKAKRARAGAIIELSEQSGQRRTLKVKWNQLKFIDANWVSLEPANPGALEERFALPEAAEASPVPGLESLTFFWLVVLLGRCRLLSWHGPQGTADELGGKNWHMDTGQVALLSPAVERYILTMRSERSPQGRRATADSGLSSGGGGCGTQL